MLHCGLFKHQKEAQGTYSGTFFTEIWVLNYHILAVNMSACRNRGLFDVCSRMQIALMKNTQCVPDIHPDVVRAAVSLLLLGWGALKHSA